MIFKKIGNKNKDFSNIQTIKTADNESFEKGNASVIKGKLKRIRTPLIISVLLIAGVTLLITEWIYPDFIRPNLKYSQAMEHMDKGEWDEAVSCLNYVPLEKSEKYLVDFKLVPSEVKFYEEDECVIRYDEEGKIIYEEFYDYENASKIEMDYTYDKEGRLISRDDQNDVNWGTYEYNTEGLLIYAEDKGYSSADKNIYEFRYDINDRVSDLYINAINSEDIQYHYEYDSNSNIKNVIVKRGAETEEIVCRYDEMDNLIEETSKTIKKEYSYNETGNLSRCSIANIKDNSIIEEVEFIYDDKNNLEMQTTYVDGEEKTRYKIYYYNDICSEYGLSKEDAKSMIGYEGSFPFSYSIGSNADNLANVEADIDFMYVYDPDDKYGFDHPLISGHTGDERSWNWQINYNNGDYNLSVIAPKALKNYFYY